MLTKSAMAAEATRQPASFMSSIGLQTRPIAFAAQVAARMPAVHPSVWLRLAAWLQYQVCRHGLSADAQRTANLGQRSASAISASCQLLSVALSLAKEYDRFATAEVRSTRTLFICGPQSPATFWAIMSLSECQCCEIPSRS